MRSEHIAVPEGGSTIERRVSSEDETELLAKEIALKIEARIRASGMVMGLCGDLGSGKTAFIRYLSKAFESRVPVSSPSYVLCHEYPCRDGLQIEHWDLYRLRDDLPEELDVAPPPGTLRAVEWIERSERLKASAACMLTSVVLSENERVFTIEFTARGF